MQLQRGEVISVELLPPEDAGSEDWGFIVTHGVHAPYGRSLWHPIPPGIAKRLNDLMYSLERGLHDDGEMWEAILDIVCEEIGDPTITTWHTTLDSQIAFA